jgi:hypothetical protein
MIDPVKIDGLCSTRRAADKCQPFVPDQSIQQAGLSYVTSPQKRNLRQLVGGKHLRPAGTHYEFRFQSKTIEEPAKLN